jgi:mannan endo-1,4-beta-mannosidase
MTEMMLAESDHHHHHDLLEMENIYMKRHYPSYVTIAMASSLLIAVVGLTIFVTRSHLHAAASSSSVGFVTRDSTGRQLWYNGKQFRFAGANIYWLGTGVSQNGVDYNTQVSNILKVVSQDPSNGMSETAVRAHTLGISAGCGDDTCVEPTLGNIPQTSTGFSRIDYVIDQAAKDHLHLIIPFVDNWNYGPGGITTWINWRGSSNQSDFYTNSTIINDFKTYIGAILNHVNSITGIAYKNDPTILAWEEGNELNDAPASWIDTIASYIKSQDPNHLVAFGSQFGLQKNNSLSSKYVDIEDAHYYPMDTNTMVNDAKTAYQAGKVYYVGEYGWNQGDLSGYLGAIENQNNGYSVSGDTYWSLFPKGVDHKDTDNWSYTLHFPGDDSSMSQSITLLTKHAQTMRAQNATTTPVPTPTQGSTNAPIGKTIWLKAYTGNYVSAWSSDTNTPLEARASQVQAWEEFDVVDAGNGMIALKAHANNEYVSAWSSDANTPLEARASQIQGWEMFSWRDQGNGTVTLVANVNGDYVSAWSSDTNTPLEARATTAQAWEIFTWGTV